MTTTLERRPGRINARLDEGHSAKLEYLQRAPRLGVSDIVKRGIDLLYEQVREETRHPFEILTETGFWLALANRRRQPAGVHGQLLDRRLRGLRPPAGARPQDL